MMQLAFDVRRLEKALVQEARRKQMGTAPVPQVTDKTLRVIELCGEFSNNRVMALRIGLALLETELKGSRTLLVPVCLNYGKLGNCKEDVITFLGRHKAFLEAVTAAVPLLKPTFLVPNHEVANETLCRTSRISSEDLRGLMAEVKAIVSQVVASHEWTCSNMLEIIPDIGRREQEVFESIRTQSKFTSKIHAQTHLRRHMYLQGTYAMDFEDMKLRTMQTAAQYIVLGNFAAGREMLICNHTTTSLGWYMETGAAVLNNPITLV